jgi:NADH-quinone oxidoreductase subunit F
VLEAVCRRLEVSPGEVSAGGAFSVERATCLGLCEHAPAALVGETPVVQINPAEAGQLTDGAGKRPGKQPYGIIGGDLRILTANCGNGRPTPLEVYEAGGGYTALKKALAISPEAVVEEVKASGLVGRGGAAFPTGVKWEAAARTPGLARYIVCNTDESEPGTFKDRVLMEEDPHLTIEGMVITAYAIGAHQGYLYVRGEYPVALQAAQQAIEEAHQAGYPGSGCIYLRRGDCPV